MLSDKDLVLIEYNKRVERLLKGQTQKSLVDFVSQWLNIPELQPNDRSTTIDDYNDPQLSKQTVVDRIMTHDWPKGLYAFQLAQLETKGNKNCPTITIQFIHAFFISFHYFKKK